MECTEYVVLDENTLQCTCCAHRCKIRAGQTGLCHVRRNEGNRLLLTVYGKPSAVHIDPIEKKPLYHFHPGAQIFSLGTIGCNFSCSFCQNWSLSMERDLEDSVYELQPEEVIRTCRKKRIQFIAFTYNEPTIWFEYNYRIAQLAQAAGIKCVYVSNGYMSESTREKLAAVVDAYNIDLKSFDAQTYRKVMGGDLEVVKSNIIYFAAKKKIVEVTTLLVPGMNDSEAETDALTSWLASVSPEIPWHVSAFHPDYKMQDTPRTTPAQVLKACEIGRRNGLQYIYAGNCVVTAFKDTVCACGSVLVDRSHYAGKVAAISAGRCVKCGHAVYGEWD